MNIVFKDGEKSISITIDDGSVKGILSNIAGIICSSYKAAPAEDTAEKDRAIIHEAACRKRYGTASPGYPYPPVPHSGKVYQGQDDQGPGPNVSEKDGRPAYERPKVYLGQDEPGSGLNIPREAVQSAYEYPKELPEEKVSELKVLAADPGATGNKGTERTRGGKKVQGYSDYETLFLKSMQDAGVPTEAIYEKFTENPFCTERSVAAVRTRLSILKAIARR